MKNLVTRTPLLYGDDNIFLKAENLQRLGSYKIRGVVRAVEVAAPKLLKNGFVAASAGNMAQAVALVAQTHRVSCKIFVPSSAPDIKKKAILALGAELVERPFEEVWEMLKRPPVTDGIFFHPVFTEGLLEGYGSIAEEITEDLPKVEAVVVPFGVGGLSLGVAKKIKTLYPHVKIYCCEPETATPLATSMKNGYASAVHRRPSFIDAIGTPEVLPNVFDAIFPLIEESLIVSIDETKKALKHLLVKNKIVCEGAAGVAFAAAKQLQIKLGNKNIVAILSGGNIPIKDVF